MEIHVLRSKVCACESARVQHCFLQIHTKYWPPLSPHSSEREWYLRTNRYLPHKANWKGIASTSPKTFHNSSWKIRVSDSVQPANFTNHATKLASDKQQFQWTAESYMNLYLWLRSLSTTKDSRCPNLLLSPCIHWKSNWELSVCVWMDPRRSRVQNTFGVPAPCECTVLIRRLDVLAIVQQQKWLCISIKEIKTIGQIAWIKITGWLQLSSSSSRCLTLWIVR